MAGFHGMSRHVFKLRIGLSERHTTSRFDGLQRRAAVAIHSGENDRDSALSACLGERQQENADRSGPASRLSQWLESKLIIFHRHFDAGRHKVNAIWFKGHAFLYFENRHRCDTGENFQKQTRVLEIPM